MPSITAFIVNPLSIRTRRKCRTWDSSPQMTASAARPAAQKHPDAGLIPKRGVTGTVCANLWPIPILGDYGWFLNVYDRDLAASVGPFVVHATDDALRMEFVPGWKAQRTDSGNAHAAFPGVATGNINVRRAVDEIRKGSAYQLRFFERGGSENFLRRRNEVHVVDSSGAEDGLADSWKDPAPTYTVVSRASTYEVREFYAGGGAVPRSSSALEYFAMNLFPIFPFLKYSCFVCVWRQRHGTSPLVIDKYNKSIRLSFFDPLELPKSDASEQVPPSFGQFAVKVFFGAVTDDIVATQHKMLLDSLAGSPSTRAVSETDFRLVVDNRPCTITPNRRNEIWVEVV